VAVSITGERKPALAAARMAQGQPRAQSGRSDVQLLRSGDKLGNDDDVMTRDITQLQRRRVDDFGRQDAYQDAATGPGSSGRGGARPRDRPQFSARAMGGWAHGVWPRVRRRGV
jgi:hypothetical protein